MRAGEIGERGVLDVGCGAARARAASSASHQQAGVVADLVGLLAIDARDLAQHVREAGPAEARRRRKIGAAPERPRLAVEEHGQRPAALLAQAVQRAHVDGVDVGPLLAVDLDVDEQLVHAAPRWPRPRSSRAPSRGTSGRPHSRPTAGSACPCAWPRPAPRAPTPTSPPGCPCAAADRGWSRGRAGFRGAAGWMSWGNLAWIGWAKFSAVTAVAWCGSRSGQCRTLLNSDLVESNRQIH